MRRFLAILSLTTVASAADAHAQAPGETAMDLGPQTVTQTSYRRQLMIADSLAAGTVGAAFVAGMWIYDPEDFHLPLMVGALGFSSFAITSPIIHVAHGNVWRGALSFGARVLFPAIGSATVTTALGYDEGDEDGYGAAFGGGFALGAIGAMAFDWFVLTPSSYATAARPTAFVAPTVSASAEHVFVGVGGAL